MKNDYSITFFYYDDLAKVIPFYEETMKFELVLDQGLARIYRIAGNCYFGMVDGNRGHLKHQEKSAVLLTIVSQQVTEWHQRLSALQVPGLSDVQTGRFCEHFFFEDPAGYAIEIQRFHNPDIAQLFTP